MAIKFGHDGWHGRLARDVTFERISTIAQASATVVARDNPDNLRMVVGFDRRFLSDEFARVIARDLAALGIEAWLISTPVPTPLVSYEVTNIGACGGIIVTAGHLPATYSGLKLRASDGGALSRTQLDEIETIVERGDELRALGPTASTGELDPIDGYLQAVGDQVPVRAIQNAGLTVVLDPMWGSASELLPRLIDGSGSRSVEIRSAHNPRFPDVLAPDPKFENLARLRRVVTTGGGAFGIAISGDGTTLSVIDDNGDFVSGDTVVALIAHYLLGVERLRGSLIRTLTSPSSLTRLGQSFGVPVYQSPVGFTSFSQAIRERRPLLGGDEWGGVILPDHLVDRDALLGAMLLIAYVVESGQSISELVGELQQIAGHHVLQRRELPLTSAQRDEVRARILMNEWPHQFAGYEVRKRFQNDGVRLELEDDMWVLMRVDEYDETLQIAAEAGDEETVEQLLQSGRELMLA